eukprot:2465568-Amphidinium_carterae.1
MCIRDRPLTDHSRVTVVPLPSILDHRSDSVLDMCGDMPQKALKRETPEFRKMGLPFRGFWGPECGDMPESNFLWGVLDQAKAIPEAFVVAHHVA